MKLSILIPTLNSRIEHFLALKEELWRQIVFNKAEDLVEIKKLSNGGELTIGHYRNQLLMDATSEYVCFFDDDDEPSRKYIQLILDALKTNPDCCSLKGIITTNGTDGQIFEHSIDYKEYKTNPPTFGITYERYPNHLNVIKTEIAQQFKYLEINHGEDTSWAIEVFNSGLLKTEGYIGDVIYHYKYKTK